MSESGSPEESSMWLDAWHDPVAGLSVSGSQCVLMTDLGAKQDSNLVVADIGTKRLKVWQANRLTLGADLKLLDTPIAISVFYPDTAMPRIPSIAVAAGAYIYIYRNLKPYYKFTMPIREIHFKEEKVWRDFVKEDIDVKTAIQELLKLRDEGVPISHITTDLLMIRSTEKRIAALQKLKGIPRPYQTHSVATCLVSINKMNEGDEYGQSVLVVGCEGGRLLIMDSSGTAVQRTIELPTTPVLMVASGVMDIEYRITFSGRNGKIYSVKNGDLAKTVIEPESLPCDLVRMPHSILVGCMNHMINSYLVNGKKIFSIYLPSEICSMEPLKKPNSVKSVIIVALRNGEIRLYNDKHLINIYNLNTRVCALRFGRFGREDAVLVAIAEKGDLHIKILPRKASLDTNSSSSSSTSSTLPEQDIPLKVPQKTKLYVEQTQREREQAIEMHSAFQRDLCKLRLHTARAYMKVLNDGHAPMSISTGSGNGTKGSIPSLLLNATVNGLGPLFRLSLCIQNTGMKPAHNIQLLLQWDKDMYDPSRSQMSVPIILPGPMYNFDVSVKCLQPAMAAGNFTIYVCSEQRNQPMLSALVKMPVSEIDMDL